MDGYSLTRAWFDFAFAHTECKAVHTAMYLLIVNLNNKLLWKKEFGLPSEYCMEGLSIKNRRTYTNTLNDLVRWGFVEIIQESKNQHQSRVISLSAYTAPVQKTHKQSASTVRIDKPLNPLNEKQKEVGTEKKEKGKGTPYSAFKQAYSKSEADSKWSLITWTNLTEQERTSAIEFIPAYENAVKDEAFRKMPKNYLAEKVWTQPLLTTKKQSLPFHTGPKSALD